MLDDVAVLALAALRSNDRRCGGGSGLEVCDICSVLHAMRYPSANAKFRDVPVLQLLLDHPLARGLSTGSPSPSPVPFLLGRADGNDTGGYFQNK